MNLETFFEKFELFAEAPGAVGKMRELVLHLAVTGKLVAQDPNDALIASGNLVRHRGSNDKQTVGQHIEFQNGYAFKSQWFRSTGTRLCRNVNVGHGVLDWRESVFVDDDIAREFDRFVLSEGDIVLSLDRPIITTGLKVARVRNSDLPCLLLQRVAKPVPKHDQLDMAYLFLWLNSPEFVRSIDPGRSNGVPHISTRQVQLLPFVLPPLAEQKRIVAKVGELMALCDRLESQQQQRETRHAALARASLARFADAPTPTNLDFIFHPSYAIPPADLRKSILTLAVQGKLVPQDPNDEPAENLLARIASELTPDQRRKQAAPLAPLPEDALQYELPASWKWARFRDAAIIASNLVKPDGFLDFTHLAPDNIEKGNGVLLPCRTVREDKVSSSNHRFYPGQIVYSKIRPNLAKVVVVDFEGLCSADMYPIDALIDEFYLQLYMLSESFLVQAVRTDTRVAMPKINQTELNAIAVPVPPFAEQRRIVAKVEQLMALVDALETQLAASRGTAAKLLSALVIELT